MHTTNCTSSQNGCSGSPAGSVDDLLNHILLTDQAIDARWSQVNQAIDERSGEPARSQDPLLAIQVSCLESKIDLLNNILAQRRSIFNRMLP